MRSPSRRDFLRDAALVSASASLGVGALAQDREATGRPLDQFDYRAVQFGDCPQEAQLTDTMSVILGLNEDSLLRPFRVRENLPAPGVELAGWYGTEAFAPAASCGQWVSALCRYYAITGNSAARDKAHRLIQGYAATIDPHGKFFVHNRFPSYTYDKLVNGLVDAHTLAADPHALAALTQTTTAAEPYLPPHAVPRQETPVLHGEDFSRHCWDESYTMPENLFLAGECTGQSKYRDLAKRFLFAREFFDPLAAGENVLPGKHAYSHVNALSSSAKAYLVLGDRKYLKATENGFRFVQQQSFATGGWGPDEHFFEPGSGKLGDSLQSVRASFETPCGSYAHFKLTRYLLRITGDSKYGDSMEQVMYNTVLGAKALRPDGSAFYYSDYRADAHKTFHPDKWPCCSGTLPQIAADYRISSYFKDPRGVFVNLYIPSVARWAQGGSQISIKQWGDYPYTPGIEFQITASKPAEFALRLRIPEWVGEGARVRVNAEQPRSVRPGTFAAIQRTWRTGDHVELELPLSVRLQRIDEQHTNIVALQRGPLVLFPVQPESGSVERRELLKVQGKAGSKTEWEVATGAGKLRLLPFMGIRDETYSTYLTAT